MLLVFGSIGVMDVIRSPHYTARPKLKLKTKIFKARVWSVTEALSARAKSAHKTPAFLEYETS
jgi:hypothetical protein